MDPYRLGEITARVRDRIDELSDEVVRLAGGPFTIGSPQQLAEVLFDAARAPRQEEQDRLLHRRRMLRGLRDQHPIVPAIEDAGSSPSCSTPTSCRCRSRRPDRAAAHHVPPDGGGDRPAVASDPNLQNIPVRTEMGAQIRACFVAEPGHLLVVADYSQIELRIMAYLSGEPALLEAYHRGEDIHRRPPPRCSASPPRWSPSGSAGAKAVNFGIMYGISAFGLEQVDIRGGGARLHRALLRSYPHVKAFIERDHRRPPRTATRPRCSGAGGHPRTGLVQLPGALARRAAGGQLGHPGDARPTSSRSP